MKKILFLTILLGITSNAHAITEAQAVSNLMALGMPAALATQVADIASGGVAPSQSIIPAADNSYDLGSSSLGWRSVYADTSVLTPLLIPPGDLVVRVDADAQRLHTIGASSDTALTYTFGDAGTTAVQQLTISASTADADDDSSLILAGGGAAGGTRGASITLPGEEVSGGGDITYNTGDGDQHLFQVGGTTEFVANADGVIVGIAAKPADVPASAIYATADVTSIIQATFEQASADVNGGLVDFTKTRNTNSSADTIVANGDTIATLRFKGADGANFVDGAYILVKVAAAPGTNDMPSSMDFQLSPDGSATPASVLLLNQNKAATFSGAVTSSATGALGWTPVAGADTACNTTCTSACVYGIDTAAPQTWLACTDATADMCLCAGAS